MADVVRLDSVRAPSAQRRPPSRQSNAPAGAVTRSFLERGACGAGFYVFVGLGASLIAATWLMSTLAAQSCAAAMWCEARR
jgi:hypothetical protein